MVPLGDMAPLRAPKELSSSALSFLLRNRIISGNSSFDMPGITLSYQENFVVYQRLLLPLTYLKVCHN